MTIYPIPSFPQQRIRLPTRPITATPTMHLPALSLLALLPFTTALTPSYGNVTSTVRPPPPPPPLPYPNTRPVRSLHARRLPPPLLHPRPR